VINLKFLNKIKSALPRIRLPSKAEAAQEIVVLGGFIMAFIGLWGFDYRVALIICGIWLMIPAKPRGG
jgi:hypothetical protein